MAYKIYFPQKLGSDAIALCDGRYGAAKVKLAILTHYITRLKADKAITFAVYGHEDQRLEQLELYGKRVWLADI